MTVEYNIKLSDAENLALGWVANSQQEWIENLVQSRCRIAIDEIMKIVVEKCLENGVQVPGSKDEIVLLGNSKGWIKPLSQSSGTDFPPKE